MGLLEAEEKRDFARVEVRVREQPSCCPATNVIKNVLVRRAQLCTALFDGAPESEEFRGAALRLGNVKSRPRKFRPSKNRAHVEACPPETVEQSDWDGNEVSLDTLAGDVATVKRTLGRVSSPAILVGHSYGGTVITTAGTDNRVAGLVYIAALAPDTGETSQSQQDQFSVTDIFSHVEVADGRVWMRPKGVACFAGDLSEQEQKLVWATHAAPAADLFGQKLDGTAWKSKSSWYIVANNDRTVQPALQRFVAKRMGATIFEVDASHVAMLSKPNVVIDVIRTAVDTVKRR